MWTVSTTTPDGIEHFVEIPDSEAEHIFTLFKIDRHAWRYFGILCFEDRPGYFPQLETNCANLLAIRGLPPLSQVPRPSAAGKAAR